LLGDFAFALWDAAEQQLFCARDPIGVRQLFYRLDQSTFSCATEAHALRHAPGDSFLPNALQIALFIAEEYRVAGPSLYQGIDALPPAHFLLVTASRMRLERYWAPEDVPALPERDQEALAQELRDALREAVRCRLGTSRSVGTDVSGGLDSSSVAATAASIAEHPPTALHLRFPGLPCDEEHHARAVSAHCDLRWVARDATAPDVACPRTFQGQPDFRYYPILSSFERLYADARTRGIGTVLTGVGSDQLFDATHVECAEGILSLDLELVARASGLREAPFSAEPYQLLLRQGLRPLLPERALRMIRAARGRPLHPGLPLLVPALVGAVAAQVDEERRRLAARHAGSLVTQHLCAELERFTTAVPLLDCDQLGARTQVQVAHPYLDRRVVELGLGLPPLCRIGRGFDKGKPLLRRAVRGLLPRSVLERRGAPEFSSFLAMVLFRQHRAAVLPLLGPGSRLDDLGIVDVPQLQAAVGSKSPFLTKRLAFVVSMELWLRCAWP
jgi:asparagine synthase (glutamine-hydrolysing)